MQQTDPNHSNTNQISSGGPQITSTQEYQTSPRTRQQQDPNIKPMQQKIPISPNHSNANKLSGRGPQRTSRQEYRSSARTHQEQEPSMKPTQEKDIRPSTTATSLPPTHTCNDGPQLALDWVG